MTGLVPEEFRKTEEVELKPGSTGRIFRSRSAFGHTRMDTVLRVSTPESPGRLVGLLLDNTNQDRRIR